MFIDTHAHLNLDPFYDDPGPYIDRALQAGVTRMIVPSIDIESSERAVALAEKFSPVFAAAGIHPHESAKAPKDYLRIIEAFLSHPKVCALGEIGMDHYRDDTPRDVQLRILREQAELAGEKDIPMIIHNRSADADTFSVLKTVGNFHAQFHCFGSGEEFAKKVINKGALISFTGVVTFSKKVRVLAGKLPLEKLMTETDCPWMAPVPYRGKQNEPAYVVEIARSYAEIFGKDIEFVAQRTRRTAEKFFKLPVL
ncbi:MAG: TatD family hydrolase [Candidatus Marinimicrobia bacterium]|nr:TatD family hydrolase [Candidatus Neomarinimicrobiota bacterium]